MSNDEKMNLMAEVLDMDVSEISPTTKLGDLDAWDSVAALAFIAMMDEHFKKTIKGAELRTFETIQDALNVMQ